MLGISIKGTGMYLPSTIVTNDDFSKIVETSDEWITTRTGIKQRHISNGELTWQMGAKSAKQAIEKAGINPEDIDLIIHTSVTPDYTTPSMSCIIQDSIGAINAACIDVNCACSGFVYSLDMARRYISCGDFKTVLIVSSETLSRMTDYNDRSTCVLFGDGSASCVVVGNQDKKFASFLGSNGAGSSSLFARANPIQNPFNDFVDPQELDNFPDSNENYIYMNGREVYKFAVNAIPMAITKACEKINISPEDIDLIIPHQANVRIVETAANKLNLPLDKFYTNLEKYGNTSSASIPIALNEAVEKGLIKKGDKVCVVGFGAGLTYAAAIIEW